MENFSFVQLEAFALCEIISFIVFFFCSRKIDHDLHRKINFNRTLNQLVIELVLY